MAKTLEDRIYHALLAASRRETNLLEFASDLANAIKHQVHLELDMLEESARERETAELAIGVHVGITATKYEGMKGVIVAGSSSYWEVEIPGITHPVHFKSEDLKPFPKDAQPQPTPPAFGVGTREPKLTLKQHDYGDTTVSAEIMGNKREVFLGMFVPSDSITMELTPDQARLLGKKLTAYADWIDANEQREAAEYDEDFNDD